MASLISLGGLTGTYSSSTPTLTNGQSSGFIFDVNNNLLVSQGTTIAGEDLTNNILVVENRYDYTNGHLAANANTTLKSGAGFLHLITINKKGASSNTITVYDNTTNNGTIIAVIDSTASVTTLFYNVRFSTGLTIAIATGTAPDITVSYR